MKKLAVFLFDESGVMGRPWREAGFVTLRVDLLHEPGLREVGPGDYTLQADLTKPFDLPLIFSGMKIAFVAAFPPCTHLAVSGARWFKGKGLRKLEESIACFATAAEFCEKSGAPYIIENPVSTISTYWRQPDYTFHPWQYSLFDPRDTYTKKTCLWTGGGFVMPEFAAVPNCRPDNRIHAAPPGDERATFRSKTPEGFARAVFAANENLRSVA